MCPMFPPVDLPYVLDPPTYHRGRIKVKWISAARVVRPKHDDSTPPIVVVVVHSTLSFAILNIITYFLSFSSCILTLDLLIYPA